MAIIQLMRHGSLDGPAGLYGKTDIELNTLGWQQMAHTEEHLDMNNIEQIISSPLLRCSRFAQQLAVNHNIEIDIEKGFAELDFGDWDGLPFTTDLDWDGMNSFWQSPWDNAPPNGESMVEFEQRIVTSWQNYEANSPKNTLIICHGGVIRMILAHVLGIDVRSGKWFSQLEVPYASVSQITLSEHPLIDPKVNFISHVF